MRIEIIKIKELGNALFPRNILEGYKKTSRIDAKYFQKPKLGRRFDIGTFSTSLVQEIIDKNTIRTYNSIYKWRIIPKYGIVRQMYKIKQIIKFYYERINFRIRK